MRRLRLLPQALLLVVFGIQIALTRVSALTPWKGGGFGMFSTLDQGAFRRVGVVVDGVNRSEAVDIAPSIEESAARAVACPADGFMRRLADNVVARERRYGRSVTAVHVTIWRTEFDAMTLVPTERPLRMVTYRQP
jgi:hypothetical protein